MSHHPPDLHAFALGDLTGADEAAVARHVAACRHCRDEVHRLRAEHAATIDALPPVTPSPAARERALAAGRAAMAASGAAPTDAGAAATTPVAGPHHPRAAARGRRRVSTWTAWALTGVIAIAAVAVSFERHAAWRASDAERALVAAWLTRSDVTTWALPSTGARSPGSVMVADDGVVLVVMRAPAPAGSAYRAWGVGPDGATALGDVSRTVLRAPAAQYDEVVVSIEPNRATSGPTDPLGAAPIRRTPSAP